VKIFKNFDVSCILALGLVGLGLVWLGLVGFSRVRVQLLDLEWEEPSRRLWPCGPVPFVVTGMQRS